VTGSQPASSAIPTIRAVAQRAGVSTATVSRVLNDAPYVRPETRSRVMEAIAGLDFRPNVIAQSLTTGRSQVIGVIVADLEIPFFTTIASAIQTRAHRKGLLTLVANSDEDPAQEDELIRAYLSRGVDGIVIAPAVGGSIALREAARRIPVVLIDRDVEGLAADVVLADNHGAAAKAAGYLLDLGHRRIAYATDAPDKTSNRERLAGFHDAFTDVGLTSDPDLVWVTDYHTSGAERALRQLIARHRPTALLCSEGSITLGALRAIQGMGLNIPDDLSLIGFDQLDWSSATRPPLTVVEQQARRMGAVAADLLLRRLNRRVAGKVLHARTPRIETHFVVRGSCSRRIASKES
jgi:LacI family transcriptional regulator